MKYLTLISGKTVHAAPGVKRIPKEEFSELINAKDLLDKINEEAKQYREDIAKQGELYFEESKKKGQLEGLETWADQIKLLEEEKVKVGKDLQKFLVQIAVSTAKKIVGREIELNPSTISDIVLKNLRSVASHRKINIFVNKEDFEILETEKEKLKKIFDELQSFHIQIRNDIQRGGAIIETEAGIIDARIENLWANIEKALDQLVHKKN